LSPDFLTKKAIKKTATEILNQTHPSLFYDHEEILILLAFYTHLHLTLYPQKGSRRISDIPRHPRLSKMTSQDVTRGEPIAVEQKKDEVATISNMKYIFVHNTEP
jgi:hypothetical protein